MRPPQHSPVAEERRAILWDCELVSLHVSATRTLPFDYREVRSSGSPAARQRNVRSTTPSSALKPVLVELLRRRSSLESRAQCWFAADTAASLAGAAPPWTVRDDTLPLPDAHRCDTRARKHNDHVEGLTVPLLATPSGYNNPPSRPAFVERQQRAMSASEARTDQLDADHPKRT